MLNFAYRQSAYIVAFSSEIIPIIENREEGCLETEIDYFRQLVDTLQKGEGKT